MLDNYILSLTKTFIHSFYNNIMSPSLVGIVL
jgi:hypothetical protein